MLDNAKGQDSSGGRSHADRDGKKSGRARVKIARQSEPIYRSDRPTAPSSNRNYATNGDERPKRYNRFDNRSEGDRYDPRKKRERNDSYPFNSRRNEYGEFDGMRDAKFDRPRSGNFRNNESRRPHMSRNGNYDPAFAPKKPVEYKREVDLTKPVRLNKFLANAGICSRREADEFIQAGVITVNDVVVSELGTKVLPTDKVMFHNQPVRSERKVYLLLNKPKDCVTTTEDTHARKTVLDLVKNACSERIYPVGRLDRNTTGVLLLTNDGDLAAKLTHPKFEKKKIYHAVLDKDLSMDAYNTLMSGVMLDDELVKADAIEFIKENDLKQVGVEIHSGQNRVIRRMFEKVGYKVIRLDRVFFAGLTKKNLPRGKYRFLSQKEVNMLLMGAFE